MRLEVFQLVLDNGLGGADGFIEREMRGVEQDGIAGRFEGRVVSRHREIR